MFIVWKVQYCNINLTSLIYRFEMSQWVLYFVEVDKLLLEII